MKLEFWSDIVCPWCGLAEHRLSRALGQFDDAGEVEVIHRSFQTHPELDRNGVSQRQLLALRGIDPRAAETILGPIEQFAADEGLHPYKAIDRILGPTNYAHELLAYATDKGVADAWPRMFRAHFGQGRELWTIDQVVGFAVDLGLDPAEVRKALETGAYRAKIDSDSRDARRMGAKGVPFIVIDGEHILAGARTTAEILQTLRAVRSKSSQVQNRPMTNDSGPVCRVDSGA